jgi:predicted nucleotidyltransferase
VKWPKEVILLLTRDKALELLQGKQEYLRREFGVSKIGIFGSVARDQSDKSSDVDIVVKFDRPIGFRFIELADYLEDLLGCKADILTLAGIEAIRSQNVAKSIKEDVIYV